jgi:tRNA-dihydrouridine synthase
MQFYKGRADWAAIRAVRAAIGIPLVANGDCETAQDARAMLEASGADGVMIGRAALGRPWLVGDIARALDALPGHTPDATERAAAAVEHLDTLIDLMGALSGLRHARKHLAAYADHATAAGDARAADRLRLVTTDNPAEARALLASFFHAESAVAAAA